MIDENMTLEFFEHQRDVLRASKLPAAQRDELLRLNTFCRALLESTGCKSIAEVVALMPGLAPTKEKLHAIAN